MNMKSSSFGNNIFCNNCGKYGHVFHQCKQPITSLGIIAFRSSSTGLEYLMIRRRNSLGFLEFMRGKYPLYNKSYIVNIINEMSIEEKEVLKTYDFNQLWEYLWGVSNIGIQYRGEEKISFEKFTSLKLGVTANNTEYNLESLIQESTTSWEEPEWGFPKGRRNYQEKDLQCAMREFEEETSYNKSSLKIVHNVLPYEEIFTGSNYKSYKHKYYLGYMDLHSNHNIENYDYTNSEIGKISWVSFEDGCRLIRPYDLEKTALFKKVNKVLTQYRLY